MNVYEKVLNITKNDDLFTVDTDKDSYRCKYTILATGFYDQPNIMNIPGETLPKVRHYYNEPHPYAFQKVVVVGAGNSAVDAALETFRHGAEVTLVVREPELSSTVKYWVRPDIENRIEEGSIAAHFNSTISEITENEVIISTPQGAKRLQNDFVLAMTGYHPDSSLMSQAGVRMSGETMAPEHNPDTFETNVRGLFVAGSIVSGRDTNRTFIENGRFHGEAVVGAILARLRE